MSGSGWEGWGNLETARRAGVPVIMQTQHLPFLLGNPHKRRGLLKALKEADCVIAVSDGVRRTYEAIGVPSERLITVPNGVARCEAGAGRNAIRARLGLGIDQPVVMTVGRLTQMKAQRNLIDAIPYLRSRVPDVAVVIVGDGPLRRQLEDQAASLGVGGATRFLGHRIDARSLLEAADVFVLPSRHENAAGCNRSDGRGATPGRHAGTGQPGGRGRRKNRHAGAARRPISTRPRRR